MRVEFDVAVWDISIHALRKESDHAPPPCTMRLPKFQSTLSVRRATMPLAQVYDPDAISIHALRKESDR